jgi:hypothetical protein
MIVRELIEMLNKMPQDSLVVVTGYEGGFDNPSVYTDTIIVDSNWNSVSNEKNTSYYGRHNRYYPSHNETPAQPENCVVVGTADGRV